MDSRMAGTTYATKRNGRTRTAFEEGITGTTQNTPQRRHAQSLDKDSLQLPRPTFADSQERSLHHQKEHPPHPGPSLSTESLSGAIAGIWRDQMAIYVGFHVLGGG
jgi:hypothetical protein